MRPGQPDTTLLPNSLTAVAELSKPVPPRGDEARAAGYDAIAEFFNSEWSKPVPPRSYGTDTSCRSLFHHEVMGPTRVVEACSTKK